MAHGYAAASGKVPAVMVHVSVGTANALCGVFNAARENVPILFTAGRSPLTEEGLPGARDTYIHWAQEMFDQAGMLRELVKWDYELRNGAQLETVVDRALAIAPTEPRGPGLPVLAARSAGRADGRPRLRPPTRRVAASPPAPEPAAIAAGGAAPRRGQEPADRHRRCRPRLPRRSRPSRNFAERFAIPVVRAPPALPVPAG